MKEIETDIFRNRLFDKKLYRKMKGCIDKSFKGYCIDFNVCEDENRRLRVNVELTLLDATRFQLPAFELNDGNIVCLLESLVYNKNKIMKLRD